eukprot:evm.model.scf_1690.6 EVM.evm.TU.scf_1690.6   scf_1690:29526-31241(+)
MVEVLEGDSAGPGDCPTRLLHTPTPTSPRHCGAGTTRKRCAGWGGRREGAKFVECGRGNRALKELAQVLLVVLMLDAVAGEGEDAATSPSFLEWLGKEILTFRGIGARRVLAVVVAVFVWRGRASLMINATLEAVPVAKATALWIALLDLWVWGAFFVTSTAICIFIMEYYKEEFWSITASAAAFIQSGMLLGYALSRLACLALCSWYRDATHRVCDMFTAELDMAPYADLVERLSRASVKDGWEILKLVPFPGYGQEWIRQVRSLILLEDPLTQGAVPQMVNVGTDRSSASTVRTFREMDDPVTGGFLRNKLDAEGDGRRKFALMGHIDGYLCAGHRLSSAKRNFTITDETHGAAEVHAFSVTCLITCYLFMGPWSARNRVKLFQSGVLFLCGALPGEAKEIEVDLDPYIHYAPLWVMWCMSLVAGFNLFWTEMESRGPKGPWLALVLILHIVWNVFVCHMYSELAVLTFCLHMGLAAMPIGWKLVHLLKVVIQGCPRVVVKNPIKLEIDLLQSEPVHDDAADNAQASAASASASRQVANRRRSSGTHATEMGAAGGGNADMSAADKKDA